MSEPRQHFELYDTETEQIRAEQMLHRFEAEILNDQLRDWEDPARWIEVSEPNC